MYQEEIQSAGALAVQKQQLLYRRPLAYFISAMLAGVFVGFGVLLSFTAGGLLTADGVPAVKLIMGACFGVALSLVIMAGAELFTGNTFVMMVGLLQKQVHLPHVAAVCALSWIGNLAGSALLAFLYRLTGLGTGAVAQIMADTAAAKMAVPPGQLLVRAVLCNILVCLAVWCGIRMKSEAGKLIMVFWCLLAFFTTGFEHSVANMTLLTAALLNPAGAAVDMMGCVYNLAIVTLGNMVGGIVFMALPYYAIGRKKAGSCPGE